jgi:hypothetical protein
MEGVQEKSWMGLEKTAGFLGSGWNFSRKNLDSVRFFLDLVGLFDKATRLATRRSGRLRRF